MGLRCAYLVPNAFERCLNQQADRMLGVTCFAHSNTERLSEISLGLDAIPFARLAMPALDVGSQASSLYEVWFADGDIVRGKHGPVHFSYNQELLYGVLQIDEQDRQFEGGRPYSDKTPLQLAVEQGYTALFETVDSLGYNAILRVWNYIADINAEECGVERYRQFNTGRQAGFLASGHPVTGSVPAASAVGTRNGPLVISFLASRGDAPTSIENPRQVSAYQYPRQYGPASPTFSRACMASVTGDEILFVSGTASIVGHLTLHVGDAAAQATETVANLTAILDQANRVHRGANLTLADLCCKVYVRDPADLPTLDAALRACVGPTPKLVYIQADICRAGLAMEIEATAGHPVAFSA